MKMLKKLAALILAATMVLVLFTPAAVITHRPLRLRQKLR